MFTAKQGSIVLNYLDVYFPPPCNFTTNMTPGSVKKAAYVLKTPVSFTVSQTPHIKILFMHRH